MAGAASLSLGAFIPRTGFAADTDAVVIGAGAAGLAAASTLLEAGLKVAVVEARERPGGRAFTEQATFDVPFDHGCTFLHIAHRNPWVSYAREHGFEVGPLPDDDDASVWVGQREANGREYAAMEEQWEAFLEALAEAGEAGRDISAAVAVKDVPRSSFARLVENWIGYPSGRDFDQLSTLDYWNEADGEDLHARDGYGTLVAHFGRSIPVEFETIAEAVDWSGPGVRVSTSKGTVTAKQCIVTVSNGVLLDDQIRFTPGLPDWKRAALDGVPMASFVTIGLQFERRRILPVDDGAMFLHWTGDGRDLAFVGNLGGWGVQRANAGGRLADELEAAGEDAAVAFALDVLKSTFGSDATRGFIRGSMSSWGSDRFARGAWSAAKPGEAHRRPDLVRDLDGRVHFAGEACHEDMFTTCHGAFLSGRQVADAVARLVTDR